MSSAMGSVPIDWKAILGDFVVSQNIETCSEESILKHLRELYTKQATPQSTLASDIPRFHFKKISSSDLKQAVRKEARTRFLEKKAEDLLDEDDLESLWSLMSTHQTPPNSRAGERLNYEAFRKIGKMMPAKAACFFLPSVFLSFPRDDMGRISARLLFHFVVRRVSLTQLRISLTCYDEVGAGYLREQDIESYVFEQIPSLPQLSSLEVDFFPYYVFTAVRKFIFFLDPLRKGKVSISDLVTSLVLRDFNELRQTHVDEDAPSGWFTSRGALKVYATYLHLDVDHNGMLSKEEFSRYNGGSLTHVFVDRLFQEYRMYQSDNGQYELDYKSFLDFVLAMRNRSTIPSMRYFWKVLDVNKEGYLTLWTLNYFFKAVNEKMIELGHEPVRIEDITSEIFDMVSPKHPHRITFDDLVRSKCGKTVISILIDVNGFWMYDNREQLIGHEEED